MNADSSPGRDGHTRETITLSDVPAREIKVGMLLALDGDTFADPNDDDPLLHGTFAKVRIAAPTGEGRTHIDTDLMWFNIPPEHMLRVVSRGHSRGPADPGD
jgi:hypothetical protein